MIGNTMNFFELFIMAIICGCGFSIGMLIEEIITDYLKTLVKWKKP